MKFKALRRRTALPGWPAVADRARRQLVVNGEIEMITETAAPEHMEGRRHDLFGLAVPHRRDPGHADGRFRQPGDDLRRPGAATVWEHGRRGRGQVLRLLPRNVESIRRACAPSMPKWNEDGEVWSMEMQVNDCRDRPHGRRAWKWSGQRDAGMVALIASAVARDAGERGHRRPGAATWEQGKEIYYTRYGQLELSCANCHEDNYGN
jgi:sulfur-oxidizing protein SoxA